MSTANEYLQLILSNFLLVINSNFSICSLKVYYTGIIYHEMHFPVIAFVLPTNKSKQIFDDIGFVVVSDEGFKGQWTTVQLFDTNRTDDNFDWFADVIPADNWDHVAVGYSMEKYLIKEYIRGEGQFKLTELRVITNINICPDIVIYNKVINGFHVPCYHSCTPQQFKKKEAQCSNYHGVTGAAVFNTKTNKLLGIATWGVNDPLYELPVGYSIPNSKNFFQDFKCARRIKQDKSILVVNGYYQSLCEDIN